MNCTHCSKETDEKYIIDAVGSYYCSEECMEDYQENSNDSFDDDHPYEDDYSMLRRSYIEIIDEWKDELSMKTENLESAVDELVSGHTDFIYSDGDDGPYAWKQ
ncbi:hypothetical protein [Paenibacillus crassostreae]|uniref:Uncharacterized protein n=1 Tax=Paenibacillus crassostreae TaxID=1763538 RepID=A0A167EIS9_9BACL|nr:hypothetical protein [Paenibacillus crassostreae]AOZ94902.1 hypothetical protein LPB68_21825 [Paenibacillus crassostreae]OAB75585.1 hypothetical protein PNBC_08115 [Paenibacillus crassostreae]